MFHQVKICIKKKKLWSCVVSCCHYCCVLFFLNPRHYWRGPRVPAVRVLVRKPQRPFQSRPLTSAPHRHPRRRSQGQPHRSPLPDHGGGGPEAHHRRGAEPVRLKKTRRLVLQTSVRSDVPRHVSPPEEAENLGGLRLHSLRGGVWEPQRPGQPLALPPEPARIGAPAGEDVPHRHHPGAGHQWRSASGATPQSHCWIVSSTDSAVILLSQKQPSAFCQQGPEGQERLPTGSRPPAQEAQTGACGDWGVRSTRWIQQQQPDAKVSGCKTSWHR